MATSAALVFPTRRTIFGFSVAMVVLLLASSIAAATSSAPLAHRAPAATGIGPAATTAIPAAANAAPTGTAIVRPTTTGPSVPLSAVIGSLQVGGGPAAGLPFSCTATSLTAAGCSPSVRPAVYGPLAWHNESPLIADPANHPASGSEASLAYDFSDNAYVFFGGCLLNACPSSQTWIYQFGTWVNVTGFYTTTPSARDAAAMDYDANFGAVLLYGGCDPYGTCPMADTWTFTLSSGWVNQTGNGCTGACPAAAWGASLAWDSFEYASVLVDGCGDANCATVVNQTFNNWGPGTYWENPGFTVGPLPRALAALAWDPQPIVNGLILFGGVVPCVTGYCALNDTWAYDAVYGWTEVDAFNYLATGSPMGTFGAAFSWDSATGSMILAGGINFTYGVLPKTWSFVCVTGPVCSWTDISGTAPAPARAYMASAENNSGFAPWFVGGDNGSFLLESDQWAFGVAPTAVGYADPNPTEIGSQAGTWINNTVTGGVGPFYQTLYLPASGNVISNLGGGVPIPANEHFWFNLAGSYVVDNTVFDSYGLLAWDTVTIVVNPNPTVNITANPLADVNGTTPFSAVVAPHTGVGPFSYNWTWGDGSATGHGASSTHAFGAKGNYTVMVNVTDRFGYFATALVNITVGSGPSVQITATPMSTDAALNVTFSATGASGQGPYTYAWNFGDGATASGASVKHAFAAGGQYKVNVTLTDSVGGSAKSSVTVTVAQPLAATITTSPSAPTTSTPVTFSVTASGGSGTYTYAWSFGDGSAGATTASATHTYATKGTYTASVVITDSLGVKVTKSVSVTVSAPAGTGTTSAGGLTGVDIALIVVVLLVIVGVAAMLMMRRRKPTSTGSMAAPPMGATGGSPPPSGPGSPPPP